MTRASARLPVMLLAVLAAAAGCSGASTSATAGATSQAAAWTPSPGESAAIAAFRAGFPELAQDRSDHGIADDLARACSYPAEDGMTAKVFVTRMTAALQQDTHTPTNAEVWAFFDLAKKNICPTTLKPR